MQFPELISARVLVRIGSPLPDVTLGAGGRRGLRQERFAHCTDLNADEGAKTTFKFEDPSASERNGTVKSSTGHEESLSRTEGFSEGEEQVKSLDARYHSSDPDLFSDRNQNERGLGRGGGEAVNLVETLQAAPSTGEMRVLCTLSGYNDDARYSNTG